MNEWEVFKYFILKNNSLQVKFVHRLVRFNYNYTVSYQKLVPSLAIIFVIR